MTTQKKPEAFDKNIEYDEERREFLRKSMYAAFATPVIMSLLVEKANAGSGEGGPCFDIYGNQIECPK